MQNEREKEFEPIWENLKQELNLTDLDLDTTKPLGVVLKELALEELRILAASHDWNYDYSDDHSVWKKGNETQQLINALYKKCLTNGYTEQELRAVLGFDKS